MRLALVLPLLLLAGCNCNCPAPQTVGPLPPPISLYDQVDALNTRARALPTLMVKGTLVLRYQDNDGSHHQDTIDLFLLDVRQRYGAEGLADPADAYLRGSVLSDVKFEGGKNQQKWWFINKIEKIGWMGDVAENPGGPTSHANNVMRADLVLQTLAITEIQPRAGGSIAMEVHDSTGANALILLKLRPDGTSWVTREILVDRVTGNVKQVTLGTPAGRLGARSTMSDYQPVTYKDPADAPQDPPKFPHDIRIDYPAQKLNIHFTVESAQVTPLREQLFDTPNFENLNIKNAEAAHPK